MSAPSLVTGASGFIGYHVARALLERGNEVRALVRPRSPRDDLDALGCSCIIGDIRDVASLRRAMEGCCEVFHAAADYRLWAKDPDALYAVNVQGTENVIRAARASGVPRVIYTSTVGALGLPADGTPGNEDTPVSLADMVGHYKRSKFLAERRAREVAAELGIELYVVHPSTPVGERDIRPTPTGRIVVDYMRGRMPAYVDTGLNLVDVHDVAEGHILAPRKGVPFRSYILGCRNMTLREILHVLASIAGRRPPWARLPYAVAYGTAVVDTFITGTLLGREPHVSLESVRMARKRMFFDSTRAVTELGLPQSPVEKALERAVRWFTDHGYLRKR
jgi:dihydroflavonol-4-reductase